MKLGFIVPIKYLDEFASQSDFHLILPHVLEMSEEYLNFYRERSRRGDFVVCDNGVFELQESYPDEKLLEGASRGEADEGVVPEVLRDSQKSLEKAEKFLPLIPRNLSVAMTVQGDSFEEMESHYKEILKRFPYIDTINIPFDIDCVIPGAPRFRSKTLQRVVNRIAFVDRLLEKNVISRMTQHHLLGLSDGVELQHYSSNPEKYRFIRSNDSSSSFVHGSKFIRYTERGLPCEKVEKKVDFGMDVELSRLQVECIQCNIDMLKGFVGVEIV